MATRQHFAYRRSARFALFRHGDLGVDADLEGMDLRNLDFSSISRADTARVSAWPVVLGLASVPSLVFSLIGPSIGGVIALSAVIGIWVCTVVFVIAMAMSQQAFGNVARRQVDLSSVNFKNANLVGAMLVGVNLSDADLSGAVLDGADLRAADLSRARLDRSFDRDSVVHDERTIWPFDPLREHLDA